MPKSDSKILKEIAEDVKEIKERFHQLDKKVAVIEVKSSMFGTVGGLLAGCAALFIPRS
jgi:hypothetical protein